jgi:FKBP-type peptidyl-prolyl cis-trans isomerase FklB
MKQFFLVVGVSMIAVVIANAQGKPKSTAAKPKPGISKNVGLSLKTSTDSFSYALGMNVAHNLQSQGIDKISNAAMQRAIEDVFNNRTFLMNDQQANMCIQTTLQANMSKKNGVVRAKGEAFLEENKKKPGVITLPSGLQYEVLTKGNGNSASPKEQDTVVAHYKGTLIDGKPFDNSYDRGEPLTIGVSSVIRGWTEILQLMHIGDKFRVFIPSELGYGERGAGADIPGGSALIFEMELLGIKPAVPAEVQK